MKRIRPLRAYQKANPEYVKLISDLEGGKSKKSTENYFYWMLTWFKIKVFKEDKKNFNFFFDYENQCKPKYNLAISEIGRVWLYGWYYGVTDFGEMIGKWIIKSMLKNEGSINESEYKDCCNHIRNNFIYYYQNQKELKYYIINKLFNKELQPLLPKKSERHQLIDDVVDIQNKAIKNNLKKDKNFYIKRTDFLEGYIDHLQDILESYNVFFDSEEEYSNKHKIETKKLIEEYSSMIDNYNNQVIEKTDFKVLLS